MVWYLNGEAALERARMAAFFGVDQLCLSDLSSVADYDNYNLLEGLDAGILPQVQNLKPEKRRLCQLAEAASVYMGKRSSLTGTSASRRWPGRGRR